MDDLLKILLFFVNLVFMYYLAKYSPLTQAITAINKNATSTFLRKTAVYSAGVVVTFVMLYAVSLLC